MGENPSVTAKAEDGGGVNKWVIGGLLLMLFLVLGAFIFEIVSLGRGAENHEGRIAVLEKNDSQNSGRIKVLQKASSREVPPGKIEEAIKDHESRLHSKKPLTKRHASAGKQKVVPAKNIDTVALLANAIKSCADRGGELVSEGGKVICAPKVASLPIQTTQPKVAQLDTSKVGTPCPGGGRSGTYQIINGQVACLLDGVVRVTESSYHREPEVVDPESRRPAYDRNMDPSLEDSGYYEEDKGSSWLPWGIAAGALAWGLNRNTSSAPAAAVATGRLPAVITGPAGPGVITGPAW